MVSRASQRRWQLRQRLRVGDQQLKALGRGGRAKGRKHVVEGVRVGVRRRVTLARVTGGKGSIPSGKRGNWRAQTS